MGGPYRAKRTHRAHGFVADTLDKAERGELPVALAVVEGRLVVTSSAVPSESSVLSTKRPGGWTSAGT